MTESSNTILLNKLSYSIIHYDDNWKVELCVGRSVQTCSIFFKMFFLSSSVSLLFSWRDINFDFDTIQKYQLNLVNFSFVKRKIVAIKYEIFVCTVCLGEWYISIKLKRDFSLWFWRKWNDWQWNMGKNRNLYMKLCVCRRIFFLTQESERR